MDNGSCESIFNIAEKAVLKRSSAMPANSTVIQGYDFNKGIDYDALLECCMSTGFQASHFSQAVQEINAMLTARDEQFEGDHMLPYPEGKQKRACTIFLGYTSNLVTSGVRENIRYLVEHDLVDCIVTSAGGVEEDLIKCLAPSYLGSFDLDGRTLRRDGLNRLF
uniref:Deoxyhypusine synthase n=1 Tax=Elaeophora elaphi TaxID=1147741 RepID=A0A0R3RUN5_9BILA